MIKKLQLALRSLDPDSFESLCFQLQRERFPGITIKKVEGKGGDKGIDSFAGEFPDGLIVWQCKHFPTVLQRSQKRHIEKSLQRVLKNFSPKCWILCIPIDLDIRNQEWFQNLQKRHERNTRVALFQGSEIIHQLIFRKQILDFFFPDLGLSSEQLNQLIHSGKCLTDNQIRNRAVHSVQDFIKTLEDKDPRFRFMIKSPVDPSTFVPRGILGPDNEPGLLMSMLERNLQVDVFARDVEALRLNPPKINARFKMSALDKLQRHIRTGSTEEFSSEEIIECRSTLDDLFPGLTTPQKVVLATSEELRRRKVSVRAAFREGTEEIKYEVLEFRLERLGQEEFQVVTCDSDLPFEIRITMGIQSGGHFNLKTRFDGKEIHSVQKAQSVIALIDRGAEIEIFDLRHERVLLKTRFSPKQDCKESVEMKRLVDDLVRVSDAFRQPLKFMSDYGDHDPESLRFLLEILEKGRISIMCDEINLPLIKEGSRIDTVLSSLDSDQQLLCTLPRYVPAPHIMGTEFDTGPMTVYCRRVAFTSVEEIKSAYSEAPEGEVVLIRAKPLDTLELTFHNFSDPKVQASPDSGSQNQD